MQIKPNSFLFSPKTQTSHHKMFNFLSKSSMIFIKSDRFPFLFFPIRHTSPHTFLPSKKQYKNFRCVYLFVRNKKSWNAMCLFLFRSGTIYFTYFLWPKFPFYPVKTATAFTHISQIHVFPFHRHLAWRAHSLIPVNFAVKFLNNRK